MNRTDLLLDLALAPVIGYLGTKAMEPVSRTAFSRGGLTSFLGGGM